MNTLTQLKKYTTIVVDSSDLDAVERFRPLDATTNPSLITAAAKQESNKALINQAYQQAQQEFSEGLCPASLADLTPAEALIERTIDILTVKLGVEILKYIEGRVSTEVDARLSFNTAATVQKAHELMALYQQFGISRERILIKIASTWQGIEAARMLEKEGIHCNLTLLFGMHQAQACAQAGVTLISPFVGRILDWYKKAENKDSYPIEQDPGVLSVRKIYTYYKQQGIRTQVMGASFRSTDQVLALAGCDLLTISPQLLQQLQQLNLEVTPCLSEALAQSAPSVDLPVLNEAAFYQALDADLMASQLLQVGIDGFIVARDQLAELLKNSFVL
ncbi:transaldolase [Pelistega europaea]|uniref:Transaldolase n=1 Tax=Pelistega europaea TaxID=106147 RepID=A0A7Y4LAL1_9BURK|nr:transaldolase [Pelistega europaea]NOL49943.1 transaldolase [Pelistega europaea]